MVREVLLEDMDHQDGVLEDLLQITEAALLFLMHGQAAHGARDGAKTLDKWTTLHTLLHCHLLNPGVLETPTAGISKVDILQSLLLKIHIRDFPQEVTLVTLPIQTLSMEMEYFPRLEYLNSSRTTTMSFANRVETFMVVVCLEEWAMEQDFAAFTYAEWWEQNEKRIAKKPVWKKGNSCASHLTTGNYFYYEF